MSRFLPSSSDSRVALSPFPHPHSPRCVFCNRTSQFHSTSAPGSLVVELDHKSIASSPVPRSPLAQRPKLRYYSISLILFFSPHAAPACPLLPNREVSTHTRHTSKRQAPTLERSPNPAAPSGLPAGAIAHDLAHCLRSVHRPPPSHHCHRPCWINSYPALLPAPTWLSVLVAVCLGAQLHRGLPP